MTGQFDDVREALTGLDPLAVASSAAGLHAVPQNGDRLWRLEVLAGLAAELERRERSADLTVTRLEAVVSGGSLAAVAAMSDDPFEELLTEEMSFCGGSYLISPGLAMDGVFVLRLVTQALLVPGVLPEARAAELSRCTVAALSVSDAALRRAGLERNVRPSTEGTGITLPDATTLQRLQRAMTFRDRELGRDSASALKPLTLEAGTRRFSDEELAEGVADVWPLLHAGGWTVLARPFAVAVALRHHITVRAAEEVGAAAAAERFGVVVDAEVFRSLRQMMLSPEVPSPRSEDRPFTEIYSRCDTDKVVVALVLADDLDGLAAESPYTTWNDGGGLEAAHARLDEIAAEHAPDDEVLGVVILQPAGRFAVMGRPATEAANRMVLSMTAADLDVIAFSEASDPLALWKFARAERDLADVERVVASTTLDLYAVYRGSERSLATHRGATGLLVQPGAGGRLRQDARASRDRHGVPYVDGSVREVERADEEGARSGAPYHQTAMRDPRLARLVEAPVPIWVTGPDEPLEGLWHGIDAVAYWVSELVAEISSLLDGQHVPCLRIEAEFDPLGF